MDDDARPTCPTCGETRHVRDEDDLSLILSFACGCDYDPDIDLVVSTCEATGVSREVSS